MEEHPFNNQGSALANVEALESKLANIPADGLTLIFEPGDYEFGCYEDHLYSPPRLVEAIDVTAELLENGAPRYKCHSILIEPVASTIEFEPGAYSLPPVIQDRHNAPFLIFKGSTNSTTGDKTRILFNEPIPTPPELEPSLLEFINVQRARINRTALPEGTEGSPFELFLAKLHLHKETLPPEEKPENLDDLLSDSLHVTGMETWHIMLRVYHGAKMFWVKNYLASEESHLVLFDELTFEGRHKEFYEAGWRTGTNQFDQSVLLFTGEKRALNKMNLAVVNCEFNNALGDGLQIRNNSKISVLDCTATNCRRGGIVVTSAKNDIHLDSFISKQSETSLEPDIMSPLNIEIDEYDGFVSEEEINDFKANVIRIYGGSALWAKFLMRDGSDIEVTDFDTFKALTVDLHNSKAAFQDCDFSTTTNKFISNYWNQTFVNFGNCLVKDCTFTVNDFLEDGPPRDVNEGIVLVTRNFKSSKQRWPWRLEFVGCSFINATNGIRLREAIKNTSFNKDSALESEDSLCTFDQMRVEGSFQRVIHVQEGSANILNPNWLEAMVSVHYLLIAPQAIKHLPLEVTISGNFKNPVEKSILEFALLNRKDKVLFNEAYFSPEANKIQVDQVYLGPMSFVQHDIFKGGRTIRHIGNKTPVSGEYPAPGLPGDSWQRTLYKNYIILTKELFEVYECSGFDKANISTGPNGQIKGDWKLIKRKVSYKWFTLRRRIN